jgi:antitoxin PrlF
MRPTRLTKKGQVTIPKDIRDFLEIEPGDKLLFEISGKDVIIKPIRKTIFDFRGKAMKGK